MANVLVAPGINSTYTKLNLYDLQVLALGRNASALAQLAQLDARVVPVTLKPNLAPLEALKAALGQEEVSGCPAQVVHSMRSM